MKKDTKKTTKTVKPAYTIDMTDATSCKDVVYATALAKHNAGQALTDNQLMSIVEKAVEFATLWMAIFNTPYIVEIKKNVSWIKKIWNKVKGFFSKKK